MSITVYHPHVENAISSRPHTAVFLPTGSSNRRQARCQKCGERIPAGTGYQWDYTAEAYQFIRFDSSCYYCRICHQSRYALLQLEPEIQAEMAKISAWCNEYVTLHCGYLAVNYIQRLVTRFDLLGAELAAEIAKRLPSLRDTSYESVKRLADYAAMCVGEEERDDPRMGLWGVQ